MTALDIRKYRIIQQLLSVTQEEVIAAVERSVGLASSSQVVQDRDERMERATELLAVDYEEDEELTAFTSLDGDTSEERKEKFWEAVKPIRKGVTLEQIMREQNYKPIDREEFFRKAEELNIEEPLEDLLAMLTP
ncbi:MAG: hypothetical protein AAF849_21980 [Bacteroidota bacterium]